MIHTILKVNTKYKSSNYTVSGIIYNIDQNMTHEILFVSKELGTVFMITNGVDTCGAVEKEFNIIYSLRDPVPYKKATMDTDYGKGIQIIPDKIIEPNTLSEDFVLKLTCIMLNKEKLKDL
jgi:hypothetical protein